MNQTRNIILIGCPGVGKTSIANLIIDRNEKLETTKEVEIVEFESNINDFVYKYRIIDVTPSVDSNGNFSLEKFENLLKCLKYLGDDNNSNLSRFFFVVKEGMTIFSFSDNELKLIDLLRSNFFLKAELNYLTVINTGVKFFREENLCKTNWLVFERNFYKNFLIESNNFIQIDNPFLKNYKYDSNEFNDYEDEDVEFVGSDFAKEMYQKGLWDLKRQKKDLSREKLIDFLIKNHENFYSIDLKKIEDNLKKNQKVDLKTTKNDIEKNKEENLSKEENETKNIQTDIEQKTKSKNTKSEKSDFLWYFFIGSIILSVWLILINKIRKKKNYQ